MVCVLYGERDVLRTYELEECGSIQLESFLCLVLTHHVREYIYRTRYGYICLSHSPAKFYCPFGAQYLYSTFTNC